MNLNFPIIQICLQIDDHGIKMETEDMSGCDLMMQEEEFLKRVI